MAQPEEEKELTDVERDRAVKACLTELGKDTKVFQARWAAGELLTAKVLRSTPAFWYMRFSWSRREVETLFLKARIYVDSRLEDALTSVFGEGYKGPRWVPRSKREEYEAKLARRDFVPTKVSSSMKYKTADTLSAKSRVRDKVALFESRDRLWASASAHGSKSEVSPQEFADNLGENCDVKLSHELAEQLFDKCGLGGTMDQSQFEDLLKSIEKVDISSLDFSGITMDSMDLSTAQSVMRRVLLAANMDGMHLDIDDFLASKISSAHMSPIVFLPKLSTRDTDWSFRVKAMEELADGLGNKPEYEDYLKPDTARALLIGWGVQTLDDRDAVAKTALDTLPKIYRKLLAEGGPELTEEMLQQLGEVLDGLFLILDSAKHKKNRDAAKQAIAQMIDDVVEAGGPSGVLYGTGLLNEQLSTEKNTSPLARRFALEQMKRILFGSGGKVTTDESKLPTKDTVEREWLDMALDDTEGPSEEYYTQGGKKPRLQQSGDATKDPVIADGDSESFSGDGDPSRKKRGRMPGSPSADAGDVTLRVGPGRDKWNKKGRSTQKKRKRKLFSGSEDRVKADPYGRDLDYFDDDDEHPYDGTGGPSSKKGKKLVGSGGVDGRPLPGKLDPDSRWPYGKEDDWSSTPGRKAGKLGDRWPYDGASDDSLPSGSGLTARSKKRPSEDDDELLCPTEMTPLFDKNGDPVMLEDLRQPDGSNMDMFDSKKKPVSKKGLQAYGCAQLPPATDLTALHDPKGKPILYGAGGPQHSADGKPIPFFDETGKPVPVYSKADRPKLLAFGGPISKKKGVPSKLRGFGGLQGEPVPLFDQNGNPVMLPDSDYCHDSSGAPVPMKDAKGKPLKKLQAYGGPVPPDQTGDIGDTEPVFNPKGKPLLFGSGGPQHDSAGKPEALFDFDGNQVPTEGDDGTPLLYCYAGPPAADFDPDRRPKKGRLMQAPPSKPGSAHSAGDEDEKGDAEDDSFGDERKKIGDEFRSVIDDSLAKGLEDPNKAIQLETGKLLQCLDTLSPGVLDRQSKETKVRFKKFAEGGGKMKHPMPGLGDFKSAPLPSLSAIKHKTHEMKTDMTVNLDATGIPDL